MTVPSRRYEVRRLDGDVWVDVHSFSSAEEFRPVDAPVVINRLLSSGEIRLLSRRGAFCLLRRLNNGRERRIGSDVLVG